MGKSLYLGHCAAGSDDFKGNIELHLSDGVVLATFEIKNGLDDGHGYWLLPSNGGLYWVCAIRYGGSKKIPLLRPTFLVFSESAWNSPAWQSLIQRVGKIVLDEERIKLETIHEEATKRVRESEAQLEENAAKRRKIGLA